MSATVIEFPGARKSDSRPADNAKGGHVSDGAIPPLADFEIAAIKSLSVTFQLRGSEAFDVAAKRQFFILTSLIKRVSGEAHLHEILTAAKYI